MKVLVMGGTQFNGLALVHEICVVEMKGQVRYEPSSLGGACFVVTLPTASQERP
jgi:signal transduction histidine kinase